MQLTAFLATLLATAVVATPVANEVRTGGGGGGGGSYDPCSGLYDSAQCCATDVLGVADLDCASRKT